MRTLSRVSIHVRSYNAEAYLHVASDSDKARFIKNAQKNAVRDSKRAVRESGMYEPAELDAIDDDERHGMKF